MSPHVQKTIRRFEGLRDTEVSAWSGIEMALAEGHEGGELWEDSTIPYLQMLSVDLAQENGTHFRITTEQADDLFGLTIHVLTDDGDRESNWSGIYRASALGDLPCGRITEVEVATLDDLIDQVSFVIGTSRIQFSPGEVYEENDGTLRVGMQDESVLVQIDGAHPRQNKRTEKRG